MESEFDFGQFGSFPWKPSVVQSCKYVKLQPLWFYTFTQNFREKQITVPEKIHFLKSGNRI